MCVRGDVTETKRHSTPGGTTQEKLNSALEKKDIDEIKTVFNKWKNEPVHIGVMGLSSSGKSAFINRVRGIPNDHKQAATVGTGCCTRAKTAYGHPNNSQVVFWDIPGYGTENYDREDEYLEMFTPQNYDYILFLFSETMQDTRNIWMVKKLHNMCKRFCIVRTKIDSADCKYDSLEKLIEQLKEEVREVLRRHSVPENVDIFALSNNNPSIGDFETLLHKLLHHISIEKRESLLYTLGAMTDTIIAEKAEMLKKRSDEAAKNISQPVANSISDDRTVSLLEFEINTYRTTFQLNDRNMFALPEGVRKTLNMNRLLFQREVKEYIKSEVAREASKPMKALVAGSFESAAIGASSELFHKCILQKLIDQLADDARTVSKARRDQIK